MVRVPAIVIIIAVIVFGFLTASTVYFYNKSRTTSGAIGKNITSFNGTIATEPIKDPNATINSLTKPDSTSTALSYAANVYTVGSGESLFTIAQKLGLSQDLIAQANSISDPNNIQAGDVLDIPVLNSNTDYYRLNFMVNQDVATATNIALRSTDSSDQYDPVKVAQKAASGFFTIKSTDTFSLGEQDLSKGTATVLDKMNGQTLVIGLMQPKTTGSKGFWALVYIEQQKN